MSSVIDLGALVHHKYVTGGVYRNVTDPWDTWVSTDWHWRRAETIDNRITSRVSSEAWWASQLSALSEFLTVLISGVKLGMLVIIEAAHEVVLIITSICWSSASIDCYSWRVASQMELWAGLRVLRADITLRINRPNKCTTTHLWWWRHTENKVAHFYISIC